MGDSQATFHQQAPQNKNDHTSGPLGIHLLLWESNLCSSTLQVKSNTSVWAGHRIYFNLWNSHGWSPLRQDPLGPDSTHLTGGPETEQRDVRPLPLTQVSLPTAKRWWQKQNTRIQKWPICSQVYLSYKRLQDGITDSMDMSLSKLREIVKDRGAWRAVDHEVAESWTRLNEQRQLQECPPLAVGGWPQNLNVTHFLSTPF